MMFHGEKKRVSNHPEGLHHPKTKYLTCKIQLVLFGFVIRVFVNVFLSILTIITNGGRDLPAFRSILAILLLFAHTVLGCCSLHARGCDLLIGDGKLRASLSSETILTANSTNHTCQDCEKVCGHKECGKGTCVYLRSTDNNRLNSPGPQFQSALLATVQTNAHALLDNLSKSNAFGIGESLLLPIRLHLVNQVILI
jgi:hypothetical protein